MMKHRLFVSLLIFFALPLTSFSIGTPRYQEKDHGGNIEAKYDGFNYETVITLRPMKVTCRGAWGLQTETKDTCISIVASLHCPGKQLDYVRNARLQLIFETQNWDRRHPVGERNLVAVADNESIKLGTMQLMKQEMATVRQHDMMREVLEVSIPYQSFLKLAKAEFVEMKLGKSTFELRDKNLLALRDLRNRVNLSSANR
jgi:hypothetical protein